jgi:hypothetical protein
MQLDGPFDTKTLTAVGVEALRLLCFGNLADPAARFGYALAYQREPATAIQDDLELLSCAARSYLVSVAS